MKHASATRKARENLELLDLLLINRWNCMKTERRK